MSDPAIGYRFLVKVDGRDLGSFTKIDGLSAKYDVTTIKEGGENTFVHRLPGRVSYDNLTLTRPVDGKSGLLAAWFSEFQVILQTAGRARPCYAAISAFDPDGDPVAVWTLSDVIPISYSGPTLQAGSAEVLVESLELAHHGFWSG